MATSLNVMGHLVSSRFGCIHSARISAIELLFSIRNHSNSASVTHVRRKCYPRTYPTLLVFPDGSTTYVRCKEPRKIIKLPLDFSKLSEAEKKIVLANRKPKQKLEISEDYGVSIDMSEYSKYFKQ